uniref:Uncharacterized protein n=1 Tax=Anopheles farauti TaxID=69004 RepID=A0A182QBR3_9DIPT
MGAKRGWNRLVEASLAVDNRAYGQRCRIFGFIFPLNSIEAPGASMKRVLLLLPLLLLLLPLLPLLLLLGCHHVFVTSDRVTTWDRILELLLLQCVMPLERSFGWNDLMKKNLVALPVYESRCCNHGRHR